MSVAEQGYKAVLAVISDRRTVTEVASSWQMSRQTLHAWLARYEAAGLEGLADRSHRQASCPHQMDPAAEVAVLESRRRHPGWGPRGSCSSWQGRDSRSASRGCTGRCGAPGWSSRAGAGVSSVTGAGGSVGGRTSWQMDVVGGFLLEDGTMLKCLTGLDDHSRFCGSAELMVRGRTQPVCDASVLALARHGVPEQILTDNGKVFTGRFNHPPTEVLFDRICPVNGIEHLLTKPRSPTTTGKIERFHRSLRAELLTGAVFSPIASAQERLHAWVAWYNTDRPHQGLEMATLAERFTVGDRREPATEPDRSGRTGSPERSPRSGRVRVLAAGVRGRHRAGERCYVHVGADILQFWIGNELLRTVKREGTGPVRQQAISGRCTDQDPRNAAAERRECQGSTGVEPSRINPRSTPLWSAAWRPLTGAGRPSVPGDVWGCGFQAICVHGPAGP